MNHNYLEPLTAGKKPIHSQHPYKNVFFQGRNRFNYEFMSVWKCENPDRSTIKHIYSIASSAYIKNFTDDQIVTLLCVWQVTQLKLQLTKDDIQRFRAVIKYIKENYPELTVKRSELAERRKLSNRLAQQRRRAKLKEAKENQTNESV